MVTCAVLELEIEHFVRESPHVIHVEKLEQGLHNEPDRLRKELQKTIDQVERDSTADTIVLGYGLCGCGTEGVHTTRCRLVIPRAHDCITLLLGGRKRYADYVAKHPGTYWYSPGWNHHHTPPGPQRYESLLRQYSDRYGRENAEYLMQAEQQWFHTYTRATYVHLTVGATDKDRGFTQQCARWLGWSYDELPGDPGLIRALLSGDWDDERFLVLEPGQTIRMTLDERIIESIDIDQEADYDR